MSYRPSPTSIAGRAIEYLMVWGAQTTPELAAGMGMTRNGGGLTTILDRALKNGLICRDGAGTPGRPFIWHMPGTSSAVTPHAPEAAEVEEREAGQPLQRIVPAAKAAPIELPRDPLSLAWRAPRPPVFDGPAAVPGEIELPRIHAGEVTNGDACDGHTREGAKAATAPSQPAEGARATPNDGAAPQGAGTNHVVPAARNVPAPPAQIDRSTRAAYTRLIEEACNDLAAQRVAATPARFALWSNGMLEIRRFDTVGDASDFVLLSAGETKALFGYLDRIRVDA